LGRREFITLLGGAAAFPLAARAQPPDRVRRIGFLMNLGADDPQGQARLNAFRQRLAELSWTEGRDVQIDIRWGSGDVDQYRRHALELVELPSSVIVVSGSTMVGPLQQMTRTLPIVFVQVSDPVGAGFVQSLARPGGNTTGFSAFEYGTSGKWLELLKEIAPRVGRAAVLRDSTPDTSPQSKFFMRSVETAAPPLGAQAIVVPVRVTADIEPALDRFGREPNGGRSTTHCNALETRLPGWAHETRTAESVRELSNCSCVITSPEAGATRPRRPFAGELRDTDLQFRPGFQQTILARNRADFALDFRRKRSMNGGHGS
jgi:putative tryptophan/tyrosine transport system substrate-binding protein